MLVLSGSWDSTSATEEEEAISLEYLWLAAGLPLVGSATPPPMDVIPFYPPLLPKPADAWCLVTDIHLGPCSHAGVVFEPPPSGGLLACRTLIPVQSMGELESPLSPEGIASVPGKITDLPLLTLSLLRAWMDIRSGGLHGLSGGSESLWRGTHLLSQVSVVHPHHRPAPAAAPNGWHRLRQGCLSLLWPLGRTW